MVTKKFLLDLADKYRRDANYERGDAHPSICLILWFELQAVLCEREAKQIVD